MGILIRLLVPDLIKSILLSIISTNFFYPLNYEALEEFDERLFNPYPCYIEGAACELDTEELPRPLSLSLIRAPNTLKDF